jgi:ribosomal-protein-alanine N-acetyltransferase
MDYSLRLLSEKDLKEVLRVANASFTHPWSVQMFEDEMKREVSRSLGIFSGKVLLGYSVFWILPPECHIMNLAVDPLWRRKKIGKTLMRSVINMIMAAKASSAYLEVNEANIPAISLYESIGFKVVGRRKRYYEGEKDALLMTMELSELEKALP